MKRTLAILGLAAGAAIVAEVFSTDLASTPRAIRGEVIEVGTERGKRWRPVIAVSQRPDRDRLIADRWA